MVLIMGRNVNVNWAEIKSIGNDFEKNANEIQNIKKEIIEVINTINASWKGTDASNFINNLENMSNEIDNEVVFLQSWKDYINSASYGYNDTFNNYLSKLKNLDSDFSNFKI